MERERLSVGTGIPPRPPASLIDDVVAAATTAGVDTLWCIDHSSSFVPRGVWDEDFSPFATPGSSPDEIFEFQSVLGYTAARSRGLRLGVGVTEAIRRHPLVLAQSFLTLSHLNSDPVILGIGAGERENVDPAGLDFAQTGNTPRGSAADPPNVLPLDGPARLRRSSLSAAEGASRPATGPCRSS